MANKYRGQVELTIDGEDETQNVYTLHYDGNALVEIEDVMGYPMSSLVTDKVALMDGFKFRRAALFHGLQRDRQGRKLTLKQCGELVASDQGKEIARKIIKGVFLAMGHDIDKLEAEAAAKEEEEREKKLAPATGGEDPLGQAQS